MELISEGSQGNNQTVDILAFNYTQQNGNTVLYPLHAATPSGNYHIRMNATIYSGSLPLSTIVTSSQTFNISLTTSYECQTPPPFTPIASVLDAAYSPLRLVTPTAGSVFDRDVLNSESGNLTGALYIVDGSFDTENINATLEVVTVGTGFSAGAQQVPQSSIDQRTATYSTVTILLSSGASKLRMNFSDPTQNGPRLSSLSDEFYIAIAPPCVGLVSQTSLIPSSTPANVASSVSTAPTTPTQLNAGKRSFYGLGFMWTLLCLSVIVLILQ